MAIKLSFVETISSKWGIALLLGGFVLGLILGNWTAAVGV
jgi:hypothetical protein